MARGLAALSLSLCLRVAVKAHLEKRVSRLNPAKLRSNRSLNKRSLPRLGVGAAVKPLITKLLLPKAKRLLMIAVGSQRRGLLNLKE